MGRPEQTERRTDRRQLANALREGRRSLAQAPFETAASDAIALRGLMATLTDLHRQGFLTAQVGHQVEAARRLCAVALAADELLTRTHQISEAATRVLGSHLTRAQLADLDTYAKGWRDD